MGRPSLRGPQFSSKRTDDTETESSSERLSTKRGRSDGTCRPTKRAAPLSGNALALLENVDPAHDAQPQPHILLGAREDVGKEGPPLGAAQRRRAGLAKAETSQLRQGEEPRRDKDDILAAGEDDPRCSHHLRMLAPRPREQPRPQR